MGQQNGRDGGAIYWLKNELKWPKQSDVSAIWWQHWELRGQVENIDRARENEGETARHLVANTASGRRETKLGHLRLVDVPIPDPMPETSCEHSLGRSDWHQ